MTSSFEPLTDAEKNHINAILAKKNSGDIPNFSALDGLLAAVVCTPDLIVPDEYFAPIILGKKEEDDLAFNGKNDATEFFTLIMRHYTFLLGEIGSPSKPNEDITLYTPSLIEDDNGKLTTEDWANGFLLGTSLRHETWERFTDIKQYPEYEKCPLLGVLLLAHENHPNPKMRPFEKPLTNDYRQELLAHAMLGIMEIVDLFAEQKDADFFDWDPFDFAADTFVREAPKVGRNDPCPCGSGKKFKKCCATLKIVS